MLFYFMLKALFVLEMFTFFTFLFGYVAVMHREVFWVYYYVHIKWYEETVKVLMAPY